LKTVDKQQLPG